MTQKPKVVVFDLDDTLYKEIDFLKSAYQEIADYFRDTYGIYGIWGEMLKYYEEKKDVFQEIIDFYKRPVEKGFLLDMYRIHKPNICLDVETKHVLDALHNMRNCEISIITDGRRVTQWNKIEALGLDMYQKEDLDFFISEEHGHSKPDPYAYKLIETFYPKYSYVYVGDNPEKDFKAPNELGWETICLLDDGRNIHKQNFKMSKNYLPHHTIENIVELLDYIR